jgi:hypothetical protein
MTQAVLDLHCDIPGDMTCAEWNRTIRPPRKGLVIRLLGVVRRDRA